jgi:hypothetical protein
MQTNPFLDSSAVPRERKKTLHLDPSPDHPAGSRAANPARILERWDPSLRGGVVQVATPPIFPRCLLLHSRAAALNQEHQDTQKQCTGSQPDNHRHIHRAYLPLFSDLCFPICVRRSKKPAKSFTLAIVPRWLLFLFALGPRDSPNCLPTSLGYGAAES